MNKSYMNKNCLLKLGIILTLLLLAIEPANARSWGGLFGLDDDKISESLKVIELNAESWNQNQRISIHNDTGVIWKFKPTVKQSLDGFDQASNALSILEQEDKSVDSENVPALSELIKNSSCKQCKKALSWAGKI